MDEPNEGQTSELQCFVLAPDDSVATPCSLSQALAALDGPRQRVWINILAPDQRLLDKLVARFGFHELAVEDVLSPRSRAKVEEYAGHLFCVVPALNLNTPHDLFDIVNLNAFLGRNYLITTQRAPLPTVARARERMKHGDPPLHRGPDFVLYQLLDTVVDEYLNLSDQLNDGIDALEDRIFGSPDPGVPQAIFDLKHQAAWLRRRISPQREIINFLTNRPHELISRDTQVYLRDVYDHIFRISENVDTFRDLLQGALDAYLTLVANRTNAVMKVLSVVATIILPLNVLTGLYGTNFARLPGGDHPYGFWIFCGVLAVTAAAATVLFRLRKWL
jgi:magnesium transporter